VAAISFATEMILMSGVNMFAMAVVMKVVLGWDINFSIIVSSVAVAIYVGLGGLRSAIFNEVLQFVLIWGGALLVPILGLVQAGGVSGLKAKMIQNMQSVTSSVAPDSYFHVWRDTGHFAANPMGVHWTGIVFGLGFVISFGYWTTDFLVVQRVLAAHNLRAARMAPIIGSFFKMAVPFIVILPGLLGLVLLQNPDGSRRQLVGEDVVAACSLLWRQASSDPAACSASMAKTTLHPRLPAESSQRRARCRAAQLQPGAAADDGALSGSRTSRPRHHRAHRRFHERHGRQCQRLLHGMDLRHLQAAHQQERLRQPLCPCRAALHPDRRSSSLSAPHTWCMHAHGIMDYVQALFSIFVAPLLAAILFGMFWKRATRMAGFLGLLFGIVFSAGLFVWVKLNPAALATVALSPDAKPMAENVFRALWAFLFATIVIVVVSMFTKPRPVAELEGLVYGATALPTEEPAPWYKREWVWATVSIVIFVALNIIFW
jgi:Na+(H+)/acetate symporter ActP